MSAAPAVPNVPRPASAVIGDLVEIAQATLAAASSRDAAAASLQLRRRPKLFEDLCAELDHLLRRPWDGPALVDRCELMLLDAAEQVVASDPRDLRTCAKWTAVTVALIDHVRGDGLFALEAETRATPASREWPR